MKNKRLQVFQVLQYFTWRSIGVQTCNGHVHCHSSQDANQILRRAPFLEITFQLSKVVSSHKVSIKKIAYLHNVSRLERFMSFNTSYRACMAAFRYTSFSVRYAKAGLSYSDMLLQIKNTR